MQSGMEGQEVDQIRRFPSIFDHMVRNSSIIESYYQLTEEDLKRLRGRYAKLASAAREDLRRGVQDTGTPQV